MESRKPPIIRHIAPLAQKAWTDADFAHFKFDDYSGDELPIEAQILLDLADALADARREWAFKAIRAERNRMGSGKNQDSYREPRHVVDLSIERRGFAVSHGSD